MDAQIIKIIGLVAGVLTAASAVPQVIKTIKLKQAEEVSPIMFLLLVGGTGLWAYYGFLRDDLPIIIANLFSFTVNVTMLFLRWKYKDN